MRPAVYRFMDSKQEKTQAYRAFLLPLLSLRYPDAPWSVASFQALAQAPEGQDPAVRAALDHLFRYEVPLLQEEERLVALGLEGAQLRDALAEFEERFWEARFTEEGGEEEPPPYLCPEHRLDLEAVLRVVRQNLTWDSATVVRAAGGDPACTTCRVETARLMRQALRQAKEAPIGPVLPEGKIPTRTATLGLTDLVQAAQALAERAEAEGYRVVAAHPVSVWAEAVHSAAVLVELEAAKVTAALLQEHPQGFLFWPLRALLWQEGEGGPVRLAMPDPHQYPRLLAPSPPSPQLARHLDWLAVTLDLLWRVFAP